MNLAVKRSTCRRNNSRPSQRNVVSAVSAASKADQAAGSSDPKRIIAALSMSSPKPIGEEHFPSASCYKALRAGRDRRVHNNAR